MDSILNLNWKRGHDGIMDTILEEIMDRYIYLGETYIPYYVCSYAMHRFNLHNKKNRVVWEGRKIPDERFHLLFIAPRGYMKSHMLFTMGGADTSIFYDTGTDMTHEGSMTETGLIGTYITNGGSEPRKQTGVAEIFSEGIVMVDEFSGITNATKVSYNSQMEPLLLSALDTGVVSKRLSSGHINYMTNMTLWAGVQPAKYDLSGGLGRRMAPLIFLPTKEDNDNLIECQKRAKGQEVDEEHMLRLHSEINEWSDNISTIERVEYDDTIYDMYKKIGAYSFECQYFDRLMLGYHIATDGPSKEMCVSCDDPVLKNMVLQMKSWKDMMSEVETYMAMRLIQSVCVNGQTTRKTVVDAANMIGWTMHDVNSKVKELHSFGIIEAHGSTIKVLEEY